MRGSNITLMITWTLNAVIGAVSAWGSNCITFDLATTRDAKIAEGGGAYTYDVVFNNQWLWYTTTTLTYIAAIASFGLLWALIKRVDWFYKIGIITALVGAISGWTPFLLIVMDGGFTPSFLRAVLYTLAFIIMLLPGIKRGISARMDESQAEQTITDSGDSSAKISSVLISAGILLMAIPVITASTHDISMIMYGLNYVQLAWIVFYIGLTNCIAGIMSFIIHKKPGINIVSLS